MTLVTALGQAGQTTDRRRDRALVRGWLYIVAALIMLMVLVGGITRLTDSGLSITEWKPIHGVVPPLSDADWQEEFGKYRQIPQYREINAGMTLGQFKSIFWWEWAHRFLGRFIGVAVLVPLLIFGATGRIERRLAPKIVVMLALGAAQGAIGWWMVASGLVNRVDVSQYRLATHLTFACVIFAYVLWVARSLAPAAPGFVTPPRRVRVLAALLLGLVLVQIFLGGLTAGLDAGLTYNSWPLMDGRVVPAGLFTTMPLWRDFFENVTTVQFDHRLVAYCVVGVALAFAWVAGRATPGSSSARASLIVAGLALLQAAIGVATLLSVVALPLALLHQLGAVAVLAGAVIALRSMMAPVAVRERAAAA